MAELDGLSRLITSKYANLKKVTDCAILQCNVSAFNALPPRPHIFFRARDGVNIIHQNIKWATTWQNQQNKCAQRRLRSAWGSAQSDQSLRCPHEDTLGPQLPTERTAKTLIRLGGCPGWSESSLGAHTFCWFCRVAAQISKPRITILFRI